MLFCQNLQLILNGFQWRTIIFRTKHLPAGVILTSHKQRVSAKKGFTGPFKLFKSKGNCLDQLTNLLCNINNFLNLQRAAYSGKWLVFREFFAGSFIFKSVVLECTNIMCFTKRPKPALYTLSHSMLWYMFHIPLKLSSYFCHSNDVHIGIWHVYCQFLWSPMWKHVIYHCVVYIHLCVKQAYHICRCCFSKWLWSPCAICM